MKTLLIAGSLLSASCCYAVDCSTSFDQSCLAGEYDSTQVEEDYQRKSPQQDRALHFDRKNEEDEIDLAIAEANLQKREAELRIDSSLIEMVPGKSMKQILADRQRAKKQAIIDIEYELLDRIREIKAKRYEEDRGFETHQE